MGSGRWDSTSYTAYNSAHTVGRTADEVFTSKATHASLDPKGIALRESRDSADNPNSTALIVALDVTGSMGMLADTMVREGLGTLFTEVLARKPITDPHVMFMAVGDVDYDRSPLQVSQFEADIRIVEQLTNIHIEHGGGGNDHESYTLPWYFAAMHTSIDCFEKRGKKGYLFTVGDEQAPGGLTADQIKKALGDTSELDKLTDAQLLLMVQRTYHVFHVVVAEGSYARQYASIVRNSWNAVLGQNVIWLDDYTKLAEVIISAIEITEGRDKAAVTASWSGDTALVVANATKNLVAAPGVSGGLVTP